TRRFQNRRCGTGGNIETVRRLRGFPTCLVAAGGLLRKTFSFAQGFQRPGLVAAPPPHARQDPPRRNRDPFSPRPPSIADRTPAAREPRSLRRGGGSRAGTKAGATTRT